MMLKQAVSNWRVSVTVISALVFILGACVAIALNNRHGSKGRLVLALSESDSRFDDNHVISIGGTKLGGTAIAYLNDDPITAWSGGGKLIQLQHWIRETSCTIHIEGSFVKPIYAKIAMMKDDEVEAVLARKIINPRENEGVTFKVANPEVLIPIEPLRLNRNIDQLKSDALAFVQQAIESFRKKEIDQIVRLSKLRWTWQAAVYARPADDIEAEQAKLKELIDSPNLEIKEPPGDLKIEVGKNVILVWREAPDGSSNVPILELKDGDSSVVVREWKLVRINGELHLWE